MGTSTETIVGFADFTSEFMKGQSKTVELHFAIAKMFADHTVSGQEAANFMNSNMLNDPTKASRLSSEATEKILTANAETPFLSQAMIIALNNRIAEVKQKKDDRQKEINDFLQNPNAKAGNIKN